MMSEEAITVHAERAELARQNEALRAQVASLTADNEALQRAAAEKVAEIARLRADLEAMTTLKRNYAEMKDAAELREAQARARIVGILSSLPPAAFFPGCVSNLLAALTPPDEPAAKIGGDA